MQRFIVILTTGLCHNFFIKIDIYFLLKLTVELILKKTDQNIYLCILLYITLVFECNTGVTMFLTSVKEFVLIKSTLYVMYLDFHNNA